MYDIRHFLSSLFDILLNIAQRNANLVRNFQEADCQFFLRDINSHFTREGAIAILRAPVQLVQAPAGPMDERRGLVA
jgi:hypothetical protein